MPRLKPYQPPGPGETSQDTTRSHLPLDSVKGNNPVTGTVAETLKVILDARNPTHSFAVSWEYAKIKIADVVYKHFFGVPVRGRRSRKDGVKTVRLGLGMGRGVKRVKQRI